MQKNRQEPSYLLSNDRGTNFSERATFALRSIVSPTEKNEPAYSIKIQNNDKPHRQPRFYPESESPTFNAQANSPKKVTARELDRTTFHAAQGQLRRAPSMEFVPSPGRSQMNASPQFNPNRNNSSEKSGIVNVEPRSFHHVQSNTKQLAPYENHGHNSPHTLQNIQEDPRSYENSNKLPSLASPKSYSMAVAYHDPIRTRTHILSNAPIESSSQMLQNNARGILNRANSYNDYSNTSGLQNHSRFQSHNEIHQPSFSPPRAMITNQRESPPLRVLRPLPSFEQESNNYRAAPSSNILQPTNEIGLLKLTIKPPPPVEPDPFEEKRVLLAQPLSKLYSLVKNSPQRAMEPKIDNTVALSIDASKNELALKKAKSLKNIMLREGRRDRNARLNPESKYKLGILLWFMVYPYFLKKLAEKLIKEKRSKITYKARQAVKEHINHIATFIKERCMRSLELIYSETKELSFIAKKEKPTKEAKELASKKLEKAKAVSNILISILQGLVIETSNEDLPQPLLEYLASISEDSSQIPSGLLFDFELARLEFNQFSALKNMTPSRSKMIIGMFFIVRMLIYYFLTQPWAAKIKIKETPLLVENMQICSSILYHVVMDYFREKIPILPGNMDAIPEDSRVGPRDGPFVAFGDQAKHLTEPVNDDVIIGLYSKDTLSGYFVSQSHAVLKMKSLIEEWLEEMYSRVHIVHIEAGNKKPTQG